MAFLGITQQENQARPLGKKETWGKSLGKRQPKHSSLDQKGTPAHDERFWVANVDKNCIKVFRKAEKFRFAIFSSRAEESRCLRQIFKHARPEFPLMWSPLGFLVGMANAKILKHVYCILSRFALATQGKFYDSGRKQN